MGENLAGKTCIITGASSGIGLATAEALASRACRVVALGRDGTRLEAARQGIAKQAARAGGPEPLVELADLSLMGEVAGLADRLLARLGKIDILVNCAGIYLSRRVLTSEGLETQFAVNHLAPFLLTTSLLPGLEAAPAAKVITVSSASHYQGRIHWRDPSLGGHYLGLWAYEQSKLANVLFSLGLRKRLGPDSGVRVLVADPGLVDTAMGEKHGPSVSSLFWSLRRRGGTPASVPAEAIAFLAEAGPGVLGQDLYWRDKAPRRPSRRALREGDADRLWALSEDLVRGRARLPGVGR